MSDTKLNILISGSGIAGATAAFYLHQSGFNVTVVERAPSVRPQGQNIDVRGAGVRVIREMGAEDTVRANLTGEIGMRFVDANNVVRGEFAADQSGQTQTFTSDIEILRGTLAKVLYDRVKDKAEWIFGDYISEIEQSDEKVHVTFAKGAPPRDFDLIIGADGLFSQTRSLAFEERNKDVVKSLGQFMAYFAIPKGDTDSEWSRWYNAPGGRVIMTRPDNMGGTRAFTGIMSEDQKLHEAARGTMQQQKDLMRELFADAGWEADRVLEGMVDSEDFYMQQTAQVKMPIWSSGRVALIGDAAYCPSPISGMGTSVALCGAYVLAGELKKHQGDYRTAFAEYERILRPYVTKAQWLLPGAPGFAVPQTKWGISILNGFLSFFTWSKLGVLLTKFGPLASGIDLPDYGFGDSTKE